MTPFQHELLRRIERIERALNLEKEPEHDWDYIPATPPHYLGGAMMCKRCGIFSTDTTADFPCTKNG